jgi:hypothetical protein
MGGGAHPLPESKSHSIPGVRPGMVKRLCVINGLENRGGGSGTRGDRGAGAPVTEIIDRRQRAVRLAGAAGLASPGERALSYGGGRVVPRRRKASGVDQRQRAAAMSCVSPPNTAFRPGTAALLRLGHQFTRMAIFTNDLFRISLLEIPTLAFEARNVSDKRENRDTAAAGVVETVKPPTSTAPPPPLQRRAIPGRCRAAVSAHG